MTNDDFLTGIYNITPTPFNEDGSFDEASMRRLVDFMVQCGVDGLTILGVLGEAGKLSEAERDHVIGAVVEAAGDRLPVCVGTTHAATRQCIAYSKRAQVLGARAVMVAPLKLARSNDEALRRHYLAVAEAIDVPVVVQDHPASSGVYMSVDFIAALAEEAPSCRFLKLEDEPSPAKVSQVLAANPDIRVFGGLGGIMFLEELRHGAVGTMTGFAFPEILVQIRRKFMDGDVDGATALFYHACPLIRFENQKRINLPLRKEIYRRRGLLTSARVRAPYTPLDEGTLEDLDDMLERLQLTEEA